MKRILIIGVPGSGKSTVAKKLSKILKIPAYHLDNIYWNEKRISITQEELIVKIKPILALDQWIIDGNYHRTLEMRFKKATDCIILDVPESEWIEGIRSRTNKQTDTLPWIQDQKSCDDLIEWSKGYNERNKSIDDELIRKYPKVNIHRFHSRKEANDFLSALKK